MSLWRNMASVGNQVLLIDADIRNSEMRERYGFSSESGLVGIEHLLSGKVEINDVIYSTDVPNGYILPVSTNVIDPTILLESDNFREMLEICKGNFDYVIIDTPPLGSVADSLNIAKYCDGSILVIGSSLTPRKAVKDVITSLKRTDTPLLGVVLNRVDTSRKSSGYGYYYRYGAYGQYGQYGKAKKQ